MITAIFFDLDGTLLPMDLDVFVRAYLGGLAKKAVSLGFDPENVLAQIRGANRAMIRNNGDKTNHDVFWDAFSQLTGLDARIHESAFEEFYHKEYQSFRTVCGFDPRAAQTVRALKDRGLRVVLATNPLFPAIATHSRLRWAGLEPSDFELITTYEDSRHCKPNPAYYRDVLDTLGLKPEECVMVGNDVGEDMIAEQLGMQVFLLTDCLINRDGTDISRYPHGSFPELMEYLGGLL